MATYSFYNRTGSRVILVVQWLNPSTYNPINSDNIPIDGGSHYPIGGDWYFGNSIAKISVRGPGKAAWDPEIYFGDGNSAPSGAYEIIARATTDTALSIANSTVTVYFDGEYMLPGDSRVVQVHDKIDDRYDTIEVQGGDQVGVAVVLKTRGVYGEAEYRNLTNGGEWIGVSLLSDGDHIHM